MDELLDILSDCRPDIDFETENTLIDDGILTDSDLMNIINDINDAFDVEITPEDITPENFNSADSIYDLIRELRGE